MQSGQLTRISELQSKLLEMESNAKKHKHDLTDAISNSKVLEKRTDGLVQELATKNQEILNFIISIIDKEATISTLNSTINQRETELEVQRKDHGIPRKIIHTFPVRFPLPLILLIDHHIWDRV